MTGEPLSAADPEVDLPAAMRRAKARQWWAAPAPAGWAGAYLVVLGVPVRVAGWLALGVLLVMLAVTVLWRRSLRSPDSRASDAEAAQYAIWHHVDPGEPARAIADRTAGLRRSRRWLAVFFWLFGLNQVLRSTADDPATPLLVAASVVVALGYLALGAWYWLLAKASARWRADPPGPPRELPADQRKDRVVGVLTSVGTVLMGLGTVIVVSQRVFGW